MQSGIQVALQMISPRKFRGEVPEAMGRINQPETKLVSGC